MMCLIITLLIGLVIGVQPTWAITIHVPADQPTIQAGINAASSGDTVLVAPGTYTGLGNQDLDFHGQDIVVRSSEGPSMTAIDCAGSGRGFHLSSGETNAAVIRGFSIRNGSPKKDRFGGGILCDNASPVISECWISQCSADDGGGIALSQSGAKIIACRISNCYADLNGGGIDVYDAVGQMEIMGTLILSNEAFRFRGGGIHFRGSGVISISQTQIRLNRAGAEFGNGGGVYCLGSSLRLSMTDCVIAENTLTSLFENEFSVAMGGGVFAQVDSAVFVRCDFEMNAARAVNDDTNNRALGGGAAILATAAVLEQCNFMANESEARSLSAYGGWGIARGGGLFCQSATITNCTFDGNVATSLVGRYGNEASGGGVYGGDVMLTECVFTRNGVVASPPSPYVGSGGGIALTGGSQVDQCTFSENWATTRGSGLECHGSGLITVDRTIVAFGAFSEAISCNGASVQLSCSDLFGNEGGDWVGCIAWQAKVEGNMSSDPLFCDLTEGDLGLSADSPCAPPQSGVCGLIGALPVECGPIGIAAVEAPRADLRLTVVPNPVRGVARFQLGAAAPFPALNIYDLQGRLIERLSRQGGHWQWTPSASVPAGVYFARPEPGPAGVGAVKFLYLR